MPGPQIGNNEYIVTLEYTYIALARNVSITLGYRDIAATSSPGVAASAIKALILNNSSISPANRMTLAWRLNAVKVFGHDNAGLPVAGADLVPVNGTGAAVSAPTPIFTSFVVTKQTPYAGKKYRGRYYMPGFQLDESVVDAGGTINGASVTNEQGRQTFFFNQMVTVGYSPTLFHDATTPGPNNSTLLTGFIVRPVVGVQRRRRNLGA